MLNIIRDKFKQTFSSVSLLEWIVYALVSFGLLITLLIDYYNNPLIVEFEMRSDQAGNAEFFYDIGNNFNHNDSNVWGFDLSDSWKRIYFELPNTEILNLRLDPIDELAEIEIRNLQIVHREPFPEKYFGIENLFPFTGIGAYQVIDGVAVFNTTTGDPIMGFDIDYDWLNTQIRSINDQASVFRILSIIGLFGLCLLIAILWLRDFAIYLIISLFIYLVFYPGIYSPDSLSQYEQALNGWLANWHPPIMAITLRYWLELGFTLPQLILVQIILGGLGCRYLIWQAYSFFSSTTVQNSQIRVYILLASILLLIPFTPNLFYWATFWKDVWIAIVFLWLLGLMLYLANSSRKNITYWLGFLLVLLLMQLSIILRHNAVVLIPVLLVFIYCLTPLRSLIARVAFVVMSLAGFLTIGGAIEKQCDVIDLHPRNQVMALELVGVLVIRPDLKAELPYTASMLKDHYREGFRWGEYSRLRWDPDPIVDPEYIRDDEDTVLSDEYFATALKYPFTLLSVKLRNYYQNLGIVRHYRWFEAVIVPNRHGLVENLDFKDTRNTMKQFAGFIYEQPMLKWISSVPLIYLLLNLFLVGWLGFGGVRSKDDKRIYLTMLLLIPLGYYLSYILATPGLGYRFMFASTLVMQCLLLSFMLSRINKLNFLKLNH